MGEPEGGPGQAGRQVLLVCMQARSPIFATAQIEAEADPAEEPTGEPGVLTLRLDQPAPGLVAGMRAVIDPAPGSREPRRMVEIMWVDGRLVRAETRHLRIDHRDASRVHAAVDLGYLPAPDGYDAQAWYDGAEGADVPPLRRPDPNMNISMTGLQFEDTREGAAGCQEGALLLMEIRLPQRRASAGRPAWRALGRVVRVREIPEDQRVEATVQASRERRPARPAATHQIAVHFEQLPDEARNALVEQTKRVQDALIGL